MTKKILKADFGSDKTQLNLGNISIPCYVLEDGTRVLSGRGMQKAIGYQGSSGDWLRNFINSKNIEENMPAEIKAGILEPIEFLRPSSGGSQPVTYGYEATKLIDLCDAILSLKKAGLLKRTQYVYAEQAEIIIRSVAKVGIIALVDEATGYQYEREKDALQIALKAFISEELLKWQKMFPDAFYYEIFRLNNWPYTVNGIKKRPGVIGSWTKELIYKQLPKNVLEELEKRTPKSKEGNYTARFFQSLTPDIGHPALTAQIYKVIGIMNISKNWSEFKSNFNKMVDRNNGQVEIDFSKVEKDIEKIDENNDQQSSLFDEDDEDLIPVE